MTTKQWVTLPYEHIQDVVALLKGIGQSLTKIDREGYIAYGGDDGMMIAQAVDGGPVRQLQAIKPKRVQASRYPARPHQHHLTNHKLVAPITNSHYRSLEEITAIHPKAVCTRLVILANGRDVFAWWEHEGKILATVATDVIYKENPTLIKCADGMPTEPQPK